MKLGQIIIENFRQYYGKQRVSFASSEDKNVTVIHGLNGTGKTSFFSAINWCLYGKGAVKGIGELINKRYLEELSFGDAVYAQVELAFSHNEDRYRLRRWFSGRKNSDSIDTILYDEDFSLMEIGYDGQAIKKHNPIGIINSILPENVRTYFLFDGEKIDRFARPESAKEVKHAIYNVLKLELLERARKHLNVIAKEYRVELRKMADAELKELLDKRDRKAEDKEVYEQKIIELEREIDLAEKHIKDIDEKLTHSEGVKDLQNRRAALEQDMLQLGEKLSIETEKIRGIVMDSIGSISGEMLEKAHAILENKRKKGEIPGNIRQQFLEDLLYNLECICGRPLMEHGEEYHRIKNIITSTVSSRLEDEVTNLASQLKVIQAEKQRHISILKEGMAERTSIREIWQQLDAELNDISHQLKGSLQEDIPRLEEKRQDYKRDIEDYRVDKRVLEGKIKEIKKETKELELEIRSARKVQSKAKLISNKADLAQQAADAIDDIYQSFADEMRAKIQQETKTIFSTLIWKDGHFRDLKLAEDYKLAVVDRWGRAAEAELSAGERQVLSLSFIAAMAKVSGEEAPLVMDTPFGRLSSAHREAITSYIPRLADQMIIFVTDEELTGKTKENLLKRTGKQYQLDFDHHTGCTTINPC